MWDIKGAGELVDKIRGIVQLLKHSTKDKIAAFAALAAAGGATWLGHAGRPK
jgi:hypothetical protein